MPIKDYSTTAGSNTSVDGINIAEGCLPGNVNNAMRAMMADTRSFYQSGGWIDLGYTHTYASSTSFTVSSDVTAFYPVDQRVRAVGATTGTIYGTITASSYSAPNTTVTVSWDSGSLQSEALTVSVSFMTVTGSPVSTGNVTGPVSTTENNVPQWDSTTKQLKDGVAIGVAAGNIVQVDQANTSTASATTTNLGTTLQHTITGTTTITAFGGVAGVRYQVVFAGALTLTHHASNLILPGGANITTAAGDQAEIYMITASTCRVKYIKASGEAISGGGVIQTVNTSDGTLATGTTQIPLDNTIPQQTEGDEYITLAITPTNASNKLKVEVVANFGSSSNNMITVALFRDATASAVAAVSDRGVALNAILNFKLTYWVTAGSTSATTFKVRAGSETTDTVSFNGANGSQYLGGVMASSITITEYSV